VVHTVPGLRESAGGVARSVPGLCEALARAGCRTLLVSQRIVNATEEPLRVPDAQLVETRLVDGRDWNRLRVSYTPRLREAIVKACRDTSPCVLHDHGIWLHSNHVAAAAAAQAGVKRVVSPRGMLEGWSMQYRRWKKGLAWIAYQRRDLESASAFCATSAHEAENVRTLGFRQPIAVIPNGVDWPVQLRRPTADRAERVLLFMSRLHPKKGLLDLIQAWKDSPRDGWRLVIAGPDEGGYRQVVERAVSQAGLQSSVEFVGPASDDAKARLLESADLFVLPSHSENFGIVVAEALAYGIPVVTTTGTPWAEVTVRNCGWRTECGAAPLAAALREAMAASDDKRTEMGMNGRRLIEERYSWSAVAGRHVEMYQWLLGREPMPAWMSR